ncbi:MAG TPA: ferredoxin [Pseudonocardiaceae bacterium]|nr:ferredoxin [Pseudonocardiaceae bacterium]
MTTHHSTDHHNRPRLRVDPIACTAHGLCADLLPEHITLDEWGYPLLDPNPLPTALLPQARHAATACPALALRLQRPDST